MKKTIKSLNIKELIELKQKLNKLPQTSKAERASIEAEQRFEATFHSNRLEGNKLTKNEARSAVFSIS